MTNLVVLGLFDGFSASIHVDGFEVLLLAAMVLQILLKLAIDLERR